MTCPYETGECEWPQDCEDCNPDIQEAEAKPVTVEELKDRMSQDLDYMDSKTRAEVEKALYWIDVFKED